MLELSYYFQDTFFSPPTPPVVKVLVSTPLWGLLPFPPRTIIKAWMNSHVTTAVNLNDSFC